MSKALALTFCIVGYGWALIGLGNVIGYVAIRNPSAGWISFSLIFNMLLFIWPGLSIGGKGTDWLAKIKAKATPPV